MSKRKFKNDGINRFKFEKDEFKILSLTFFKDNQTLSKKNIFLSRMLSSKILKGSYNLIDRQVVP